MPENRNSNMPFNKSVPGEFFELEFENIHASKLELSVPTLHETDIFVAVNNDTITYHFENLQRFFYLYGFDSKHVWNLDEARSSHNSDAV